MTGVAITCLHNFSKETARVQLVERKEGKRVLEKIRGPSQAGNVQAAHGSDESGVILWRGCGRTASPPSRRTSGPRGSFCTAEGRREESYLTKRHYLLH